MAAITFHKKFQASEAENKKLKEQLQAELVAMQKDRESERQKKEEYYNMMKDTEAKLKLRSEAREALESQVNAWKNYAGAVASDLQMLGGDPDKHWQKFFGSQSGTGGPKPEVNIVQNNYYYSDVQHKT